MSGPADTPGSVHRTLARIRLDGHLSRDYVAAALQRPTRERDEQPHRSLSDLAPGEVYRADRVTTAAGGLLPHRFTLTANRNPRRSVLCGTVSRVTPGWVLPTALLCGARTFLGDRPAFANECVPSDATVLPTHSKSKTTGAPSLRCPTPPYAPGCDRSRGRTAPRRSAPTAPPRDRSRSGPCCTRCRCARA